VFRNSSEDAKALLMSEYGTAEDVIRMVDQEKPDEKSLGDDQVLMRMLAVRS
jgi:NADPH:quinone reductase-like Zn-dependent oxidoreductase